MSDQYYDISIRACGFLNRAGTVEVDAGGSYPVCSFAALRGPKGERAEPTYFDLKVVGHDAQELLRQFKSVINDRSRQVFASVRLSDLYAKSFVRTKGDRKGETGIAIKSRLLVIESLSVDGVVAYRRADAPKQGARPPRDPAATPAAPANGEAGA